MEHFFAAYHTDVGIKKKTNQDSLLLQVASDGNREVLLAAVCDGMGGMEKGELASATGVRAFSDWFCKVYLPKVENQTSERVFSQWKELLREINTKMIVYGERSHIQIGTTVTVVLLSSDGTYLAEHVGDTRIYRVSSRIEQMTEDHTLVAREVRRGKMTAWQAEHDARKNVLLQCIGVNEYFDPQFLQGRLRRGEELLLCSDGFRHRVSDEEIRKAVSPGQMDDEDTMKQTLVQLVEQNKERQETDNISAILIKLR